MRYLLLSIFCLVAPLTNADATYNTVSGGKADIPAEGPAHLVFIDIWHSWGGNGPEATVKALPAEFKEVVPTVWVQPRMNVTDAQVLDYQKAFPESTPLIIDDYLRLMRQYDVRTTPTHVLLEDGEVVFAGNTPDFLAHLNLPAELGHNANTSAPSEPDAQQETEAAPAIPSINDTNLDELLFSSNSTGSLIFVDALCPMPHLPGCEAMIGKIQREYTPGKDNWILVYNSLYSDPVTAYAFSDKHKLTMPAVFDEGQTLFKRYKVHSTPYFIQLNRKGGIIYRGSAF